jgi:DNA-binding transcriptional ArsR family regulator
MTRNTFMENLLGTLKHPMRGAILYQLFKGKITASQIAEDLGEKPDRVYYHLKILKDNGFVGDPEVVVRKNYVEKYYELDSTFRETLLSSLRKIAERELEMTPEEIRNFMLSFLSMAISVLQGYKKRLENASTEKIVNIQKKDNFEVKTIFFEGDAYLEWLKAVRNLSHGSLMDMLIKGAEGNIGLIIALPDLD